MARKAARASPLTFVSPMRADLKRRGRESGFTLFEALVVVAITAVVTTMLFSLVGRSTSRTWFQAEDAVGFAEAANAEAELRAIFAAREAFGGDPSGLTIATSLAQSTGCVEAGGLRHVRISVRDRSLECESGRRRGMLLSWRRGEGRLSYSADGRIWRDAWSVDGPVIVRFQLRDGAETVLEWALRSSARAPNDEAQNP